MSEMHFICEISSLLIKHNEYQISILITSISDIQDTCIGYNTLETTASINKCKDLANSKLVTMGIDPEAVQSCHQVQRFCLVFTSEQSELVSEYFKACLDHLKERELGLHEVF